MADEPEDQEPTEDGDGDQVAYPPQVEALHAAFRRLVAICHISTGLKLLSDYEPSTFSLPGEFGDLPHALLRRTDGGLTDEAWVHTEFELEAGIKGWVTLEFLAWWVRDLSRSGRQIQLRPMALPPMIGDDQVQLGGTLKFIIDRFVICPNGDKTPALDELQNQAESLSSNIDDYREVLDDLVEA